MMKKTLIRTEAGEVELVDDVTGYPGHVVLERNVTPLEFAEVVGDKLVEDKGRKDAAKKRGHATDLSREELVDRLADLEARVAKLEGSN